MCEKWEYSLEVRFRAAKCFQDQIHLCIALRFLMNVFDGVWSVYCVVSDCAEITSNYNDWIWHIIEWGKKCVEKGGIISVWFVNICYYNITILYWRIDNYVTHNEMYPTGYVIDIFWIRNFFCWLKLISLFSCCKRLSKLGYIGREDFSLSCSDSDSWVSCNKHMSACNLIKWLMT